MSTRKSKSQKPSIVKPAFAHNGGKTRLLRQILPRIPAHHRYVEPFAGGLAVLLAKPRASVEVINDVDRIARVAIECQDWEEVVRFYDGQETFFFFDPPYLDVGTTAYKPFKKADMHRLRDRLATLQGSWLLTCNDSEACREIFGDYQCVDMTTKYSCFNSAASKTTTRPDSRELLVLSPQLAAKEARAA